MKILKHKNILLIIADQHRQDCLGFAGKAPVRTPNIDRLQKNGISFDNAITPCPLCGPARASLFTSLYSHQARGILEEEALGARDYMEAGIETDMMTIFLIPTIRMRLMIWRQWFIVKYNND